MVNTVFFVIPRKEGRLLSVFPGCTFVIQEFLRPVMKWAEHLIERASPIPLVRDTEMLTEE